MCSLLQRDASLPLCALGAYAVEHFRSLRFSVETILMSVSTLDFLHHFQDVDIEDVGKSAEAGALKASEAKEIADALVEWYSVNKRDLPWRDQARWPQPPYAVWVSEIMLQQTRVATVVDYFCRWMEKWPTVEKLAAASEEEVNEMWSGLGYYRRARMLHQGARTVVEQFKGQLPTVRLKTMALS